MSSYRNCHHQTFWDNINIFTNIFTNIFGGGCLPFFPNMIFFATGIPYSNASDSSTLIFKYVLLISFLQQHLPSHMQSHPVWSHLYLIWWDVIIMNVQEKNRHWFPTVPNILPMIFAFLFPAYFLDIWYHFGSFK